QGMAVINFKELFSPQVDHVLQGDAIIKIRVIDVREHRYARFFALPEYCIDIALQNIRNTIASLRSNTRLNIRSVNVYGFARIPIGQLLRLYDQEVLILKLRPVFLQCL